jgi:RNA polymerase sigma-70 factor (ECF subfamily)
MSVLSLEDMQLVDALRAGDEAAFEALMAMYGAAMLRVARMFVASRAVAEEVVQETWIGVLNGIGRFEGRSSLKTWIFRILTNIAKTRGEREGRTIPFSALAPEDEEGAAVDPDRFLGAETRFPGHWSAQPDSWAGIPEERLIGDETMALIRSEIEKLPPQQAVVVTMRDVDGFTSEEVCNALDISETNQRVLLHRARSKLRQALEDYMRDN